MLLDVGRLVLQVDPGRFARVPDARDRSALKRQANAERGLELAVSLPAAHDLRFVRILDVAHGRGRACSEQPADLLRDGVEEPLGVLLGRDGDRDAAERSLLLGEGRELLTSLSVRERHRDERGKLPESLLGVRRKPQVAGERHDNGAPDVPRHDDRRCDEGRHTKRGQPPMELRGNAGIVRGLASRRPRPRDLGERAAVLDCDDRAGAGNLDAGLAPLADDEPFVQVRTEANEVRGVCAEQTSNLLGHDVEDPLRSRLGRDGHRDALQGRLLREEQVEVGLVSRHAESSHASRRTATEGRTALGNDETMASPKMHADEVETDISLVRRLLAGQFPHWADLAIDPVVSYGTDHDIYRLGDSPGRTAAAHRLGHRTGGEGGALAAEARAAPAARGSGAAGDGAAGRGLPLRMVGLRVVARRERQRDDRRSESGAVDLAAFVRALRQIDTTGAHQRPPGGRGSPLAELDEQVRRSVAELGDRIDGASAIRSWEESLHAAKWDGEDVWLHGDLLPGNLLVVDGRLSAVIDFGGLNVGDPACDLQPAWNVFAGGSRTLYRAELRVDDASWLRGRGSALCQAVSALPYYWDTNPGMVRQASHALSQVLADR